MTIKVTVTHDEPTSTRPIEVSKVAVAQLNDNGEKHIVQPGGSITLHVHKGVFLIVDESTKEGG